MLSVFPRLVIERTCSTCNSFPTIWISWSANCRNRGVAVDLDKLLVLKEQRSKLIVETDQTRHAQKETSAKIPKADAATKPGLIEEGRKLREKVTQFEAELVTVEVDLRDLQMQIPNLTHPEAPVGKDESGSVTVRTWGEKPKFDFTPLDHVALCDKHQLVDLEAGHGSRGTGFIF